MKPKHVLAWLLVGVAAVAAFAAIFPRAFPFAPRKWSVSREQAIAIATERFRDLGEPIQNPYLQATLDHDTALEWRLWKRQTSGLGSAADLKSAARGVFGWEVRHFRRDAGAREWTYRARIAPDGEVLALEMKLKPEEAAGTLDDASARKQADRFLADHGIDLGLLAEPEIRSEQLEARVDRRLLYRLKSQPLGAEVPFGIEVGFAGDRIKGFDKWFDDPEEKEFGRLVGGLVLGQIAWRIWPFMLVPLILVFFVRRYHEGEIGVRRGGQIAVLALGLALVFTVLVAVAMGTGTDFGPVLTRPQVTWVVSVLVYFTYFAPVAVLAALGWSVGEVLCRDRWPERLASFDAWFKRDWANATVARDALRGLVCGSVLAALEVGFIALAGKFGVWAPGGSNLIGPWWDSARWFGLALLLVTVFHALYSELVGRLLIVSVAVRRLGTWFGAAVAAVVCAVIFFPPLMVLPSRWSFLPWVAVALFQALVFLRFGLSASLLSTMTASLLTSTLMFLTSGHPWLELQAAIPLVGVALPLLLSIRHLTSEKEFTYRYDDVPPHVRRIAERERQRVELETARGIQSSILPDLPPQLNGVEIAHSYLPASEVGGDFYDVLALEDGRLAVAVGDVAGHGVSSGLVMSMARSALAVQVTFNPEVEAVFSTLNRVVYQSARKRLLATLCYAVLDPKKRELFYASAGHLYPYLLTQAGNVHPLEYVAYPLGVRSDMAVEARLARLESGDTLFLLSDGIVEARPEGTDDLFGFKRLEESLVRHKDLGVARLRDAVLADVERHTKGAPREDDQTVLVLRVP